MQLYHLRHVPWLDSQLIYHALPRLDMEGVIILAPSEPYVCIGYHQDVEQEVDVDFCREHHIPIFRREVGGGAVYLDGKQIFYQIVLHKDNPLAHGDKASFYARMLQPVVETYADLGVPARYRPINDIITAKGRKISGNGAATIGDYVVLVGNLIADFDYETMVRVLLVPDEKYRDKVFKSMRENLTTLQRETGQLFSWNEMATPLICHLEKVLGSLETVPLPQVVYQQVEMLEPLFLSEDWLYKKGKRRQDRTVRIAAGVDVVQRIHKAAGGLLRATLEVKDHRLAGVSISGDFFCHPEGAIAQLESALEGTPLEQVGTTLSRFYADNEIETPGVTTDDWLKVLLG
jgi:lipoate-protein ligase A